MFLTDLLQRFNNQSEKQNPTTPEQLLLILCTESYKKAQDKLGSKIAHLGLPPSAEHTKAQLIKYISDLYNLLLQSLGPEVAKSTFESILESFKKDYGLNENYFQVLRILPIPVMQAERMALLSRQELEEELRKRIQELEDIKINLEKIVLERTQEISAERNKLAVILAGMTDAVIGVDLNRQITTFNRAAEKLTGFLASEVLKRPINHIFNLYNKNTAVNEAEYSPIKTDDFEGVVFTKNNLQLVSQKARHFINLSTAQIKEGVKVNLGAILTLHDITEEQELEAMKLDFVSMAAHELRTPLTSIEGYLSVMLKESTDNLTEDQKMFLNRIQSSSQRLMSLIENLLNVSRIERASIAVNLKPEEWVPLVKGVMAEFLDRAKEKGLELKFLEPPQPLPKVLVDHLRIEEVLNNLLTNAIAYTSSGGKVTIETNLQGDQVITNITDTGQGIPEEAIPHLFTKFFRVAGKKLEQSANGVGLGLYISKAIIELHQGKIWVKSEVGKGSTFSFSLKVATV